LLAAPLCCLPCSLRCPASARPACCATMASLRVLAFDHEGRPIQFDMWLDDLQLYLLSDSRDNVSLFDHTSRAAPAPPGTADSATRSRGLLRRTAQALYDAVVAHYSSPATAALGCLLLPYLFPELSAFATVEDLISHLHTSDARYLVAAPVELLDRNQPPMGVPPPPLPPHTPLLLLLTSLVLIMSGLLLLVGSTAAARARVAGVVVVAAGVVVGAAVEVVAVVGVVAGVGALVAEVVAALGVAGVAAVGVVVVGLELLNVEVPVVARGSSSSSSVGARPRRPSSFVSGFLSVGRLGVAVAAQFGDEAERPCWAELLRSGVAIFDLDYDAILAAMYAFSVSAEGDYYLCVAPDPGIEAATLGAGESALPGTAPAEALNTFTLDSDWLTPLGAHSLPVPPLFSCVQLTVRPSPTLILYELGEYRCPQGRNGSSLYTLATEPPQVAVTAQVSASCPVAPPCLCRLQSHQTLLWNHRLGHTSLPRLRGMHSRLLVSGLPRSLHPLPPSPAPPCLPCVEGRQRAAPHSSLPPTTAPLQTLHMDVWGPARVSGQSRERYFLLDLPVLRLHSDRGGEFSSDLLRDFCHGEGILQSLTLPASPQQNGIAERRIGLVMEVARTSIFHMAAPNFLWPFAVRYAAHQLNLWPRVSLPETSPTLRWTGKVGDASVFRFYHPTSRCVFPSEDATFDESVPFYHPLPGTVPAEVASDSAAARGAASGGAEPGGTESEGAGSGGAEPVGGDLGGAEPAGVEPGGAEPEGVEPGGAESESAES
ncbi:unnamed protein product, partial [Closterium sp. NIES-53]